MFATTGERLTQAQAGGLQAQTRVPTSNSLIGRLWRVPRRAEKESNRDRFGLPRGPYPRAHIISRKRRRSNPRVAGSTVFRPRLGRSRHLGTRPGDPAQCRADRTCRWPPFPPVQAAERGAPMIDVGQAMTRRTPRYDGPTPRQADLLAIMQRFLVVHGCPPSYREMAIAMGGLNVNAVRGHLNKLMRKGLVRNLGHHMSRAWLPVVPLGCCPCCGRPLPKGGGTNGQTS